MASRLSVRLRATLAATAIVAVALGVASAVLVGVLTGSLTQSASDEAARRAGATADVLAGGTVTLDVPTFDATPAAVSKTATAAIGASPVSVVAVTGPLNKIVQRSEPTVLDPDVKIFTRPAWPVPTFPGPAPAPGPPSAGKAATSPTVVAVRGEAGEAGEAVLQPAETARWAPGDSFALATMPVNTANGTLFVQARASLEPTGEALKSLRGLLLPGIPALLLLVAALTWLAVGRALAPVSAIRAEMADITASDLHRRVPVPRSRDEIARLAETMNRTLDRLELAVSRHKRFVADAAHELRSPLAILRTRLELAQPGPLAAEALTDVERIQALTSDLLLLARLDAGEPGCHEEVDLGQVTAEEAARSRPRPEIRVTLEVAADTVVLGSAGQLRRLVANLVDNAVRHASSAVTVRLATEGGEAVLDVRDDGPGIPAEHHEAVFDRFTRLDEARDRDAGGAGLGLAIARDIAVRHGGGLRVAGKDREAWLQARFPVI
ncbi:sensor histidine kinase [Streptosporangium sp. NBC_01469]|uniref:sensor histidine kinase n=1 Tax=Streptosporangium sp. NBC_01469 TaxID=2903898 RepID=UPI002E2D97AE|nr:ATP-binding protein [Streptosporangium sp. NBC_01469]